MFSALFTFLGGAAFRYGLGRIIDWLEKRQDFLQEQKRLDAQERYDAARAERTNATIRLQAELGIQQVQIAGAAAVDLEAAKAFTEAMKVANQPTGNVYIDAWNGSIRPAAASISILIWLCKMAKAGFALTQWDMDLVSSILGFFFADRHMGKSRAR